MPITFHAEDILPEISYHPSVTPQAANGSEALHSGLLRDISEILENWYQHESP